MRDVVVVGDANVDIVVPYPKFLNEERTLVDYPTPCLLGGGTAANTAVALARLGVDTSFFGTVGSDQYGRYIEKELKAEGIDTSNLIVDPDLNTVGVFAFIDENGERYLWGWPRVDQAFKFLDMNKISIDKITKSSWVHSSGMPMVYDTSARHAIIKIFEQAFSLGIPTSFDLNLRVDNGALDPEYEQAVRQVIKYTTYLLGSGKDEFAYLGSSRDWETNARQFVTDKRTVVVRNGEKGSVGFNAQERVEVPAFRVKVEDTVGAGDVYNAGFIRGVLEGGSLQESLLMGNAVSGYTTSGKGARHCPTSDELLQFIQEAADVQK